MTSISQAINVVQENIAQACRRASRLRETVQLIAVSKLHPPERLMEAFDCGLTHFGENYAQELRDKHAALGHLPGIVFHAIGAVQKKNAKYVAHAASVFHALENLEVAAELSKRRQGPPLPVLVQVNTAQEASKSGIEPARLPAFLDQLAGLNNLTVIGLSTMPPLQSDAEVNRPIFRRTFELAQRHGLSALSMGTTQDYGVAIEEGATLVRVGSAIFGERPVHQGAP
jgi:PLP dependent protein